eukprot:208873_1
MALPRSQLSYHLGVSLRNSISTPSMSHLQRRSVSQLRVLLVPITRNCYVLHANTVHTKQSSSSSCNSDDPDSRYPPSRLTLSHIPILKRIKSQRVRNMIDHQFKELHDFWVECEEKSESHPESWKGRLYQYSENALQRIDGYESFFGAVPYKHMNENASYSLSYIIPNGFNADDATNHLQNLCKERVKYHRQWFYLNVSLLPFTALLGLLPGPNVFIMYNGYRCYAHYKAFHGALAIQNKQSQFELIYDTFLHQIHCELTENTTPYINDDKMHELQQIFDCQHIYHHLHRVRYQIVELNKNVRYQFIRS